MDDIETLATGLFLIFTALEAIYPIIVYMILIK